MIVLSYVLIIIGGIFIGILIDRKIKKFDGIFIIDNNDVNTTRWILDVNVDPSKIPNKKEIRFKIRKIDDEVV